MRNTIVMRSIKIYLLFLGIFSKGLLNAQNSFAFHSKVCVKKEKVLIRLSPKALKDFELFKKYSLRVERFLKSDVSMSKPILLFDHLKPYKDEDTVAWGKFLKVDKNSAAFIYQYIYPNEDQIERIKQNKNDQEKKQLFNMAMLSCDFSADVAKACGLLITDSTINENTSYTYRFSTYNGDDSKRIWLFNIDVNTSDLSKDPTIKGFVAKQKKKEVILKFNPNNYPNYFSGYYIEKSIDNSVFEKINKAPFVVFFEKNSNVFEEILHHDTAIAPNKTYYYRIRGINVFGEASEPSNVVEVKTYRVLHSSPHIDSIQPLMNKMVYLHWQMNDSKETALIKNYILTRADKESGIYRSIYQSKEVMQFIDKEPKPLNYYKVLALTEYGDTLKSYSRMVVFSDTLAPEIPKGLKAIVDKKGNVIVTWNKNKESDMKGYRLFAANALYEEFVPLSEKFITDTFYKEQLPLNNLAHYKYYTLLATDKVYNSSRTTEPYKLRRPDTIAPVKPLITSVKPKQNGILLSFSPSKSEDVAFHVLKRQGLKDTVQVRLFQFPASDTLTTSFVDTTAELGQTYYYRLSVSDEDNNVAVSAPYYIIYETGFRSSVKGLSAKADIEKRNISLTWKPYSEETEKYVLYRASEKEPYTIIQTLAPNQIGFTDKELNIGNVYFYRIKAVLKNGAESILNPAIKVVY
jgi:uncharacterized protein